MCTFNLQTFIKSFLWPTEHKAQVSKDEPNISLAVNKIEMKKTGKC